MGDTRTWTGAPLRAYRDQNDLSQEGLARLIGTSLVNVSRWERNANKPTADMVAFIADRLGLPIDEFYENGKAA